MEHKCFRLKQSKKIKYNYIILINDFTDNVTKQFCLAVSIRPSYNKKIFIVV